MKVTGLKQKDDRHMTTQRILGIGLIVVGAILLMIGLNASDSIANRMSNFFTGHFTDTTTWYLVGGGTAMIVGVVVMFLPGRWQLT